jgi:hypothetical protein
MIDKYITTINDGGMFCFRWRVGCKIYKCSTGYRTDRLTAETKRKIFLLVFNYFHSGDRSKEEMRDFIRSIKL